MLRFTKIYLSGDNTEFCCLESNVTGMIRLYLVRINYSVQSPDFIPSPIPAFTISKSLRILTVSKTAKSLTLLSQNQFPTKTLFSISAKLPFSSIKPVVPTSLY